MRTKIPNANLIIQLKLNNKQCQQCFCYFQRIYIPLENKTLYEKCHGYLEVKDGIGLKLRLMLQECVFYHRVEKPAKYEQENAKDKTCT